MGSEMCIRDSARRVQYRWQATNCTIVVTRQLNIMIKKIPVISNADLSARNGVQKRGLQARAINALHCNAFLGIIIIIVHISHH